MSWLDWLVFGAFLTWVIRDGLRRSSGTKDLEGYFAGSRAIPWWAAGLSVMATQASAITVIGTTGQGHDVGMDFVQIYFGLPFAMILLCIFLVPLYRKNLILTAYEYLERRFGPGTRSLASFIFLVSRCLAFGLVIYAPAVVLSTIFEIPIWSTVVVIGVLTTGYTLIGGVNAVIWTDVKQMVVIIGGLLLCAGMLLSRLLSEFDLGELLTVMGATGKMNALEVTPESTSFVPRIADATEGVKSFWEEKYNLWSGLIGGLFLHLAYFGCDQSQVQRILTNPTARESRLALLMSAFAKVPMQILVLFIGVLLYLFFTLNAGPLLFNPNDRVAAKANPAVVALQSEHRALQERRVSLAKMLARVPAGPRADPGLLRRYQDTVREGRELRLQAFAALQPRPEPGAAPVKPKITDTNYVFPHFILNYVPPLLLGLLIAAIFAAAMSSADSALNSLTAASVVDFYRRWVRPEATDAQSLRMARTVTLFWGVAAIGAALALEGSGSIVEVINKVGSFFYGSLLGVFVLAIACPRAGPRAGFFGILGGLTAVLVVHNTLRVEYLWYNVVGCVGVLVTGFAVAYLGLERRSQAA